LDPDLEVKTETIGSAVVELVRSGFVFDYATKYCNEHPAPASMVNFHLSDPDYRAFEAWIKQQHFTYSTELEKHTKDLVAAAKTERYYDELQSTLSALQQKIDQNHTGYLERFGSEIRQILEEEIAFHYTLNKGRSEVSISRDREVAEAKKILSDAAAFKKLLLPN
jgi:carboxyl-terminal processing protease